jgi:hypothetical protein
LDRDLLGNRPPRLRRPGDVVRLAQATLSVPSVRARRIAAMSALL